MLPCLLSCFRFCPSFLETGGVREHKTMQTVLLPSALMCLMSFVFFTCMRSCNPFNLQAKTSIGKKSYCSQSKVQSLSLLAVSLFGLPGSNFALFPLLHLFTSAEMRTRGRYESKEKRVQCRNGVVGNLAISMSVNISKLSL